MELLRRVGYTAPSWASHLRAPEHGRVLLGHLPTPLMPWACPALRDLDVQWSLKRDDISGVELSGNKVRKLEFLMAEALGTGCDCVVTVGGQQSNHCRATAAAARLVGLEPHLVLVVKTGKEDTDPGMEGNLLAARMLGARLHICAAADYYRCGGDLAAMDRLNEAAAEQLRAEGRRPYVVPVGGTAPLATWGYLSAVDELQQQLGSLAGQRPVDHVVFAAGTGGTAAGLALGARLAGLGAQMHAVNVQHSPDDFFPVIDREAQALGSAPASEGTARDWLSIHDGSGSGYAVTTPDELGFIRDVGFESGVVLDHVYTGKALYHFCRHARDHPERFRGKHILFWHTGGLPGLAAKAQELAAVLPPDRTRRLRLPPAEAARPALKSRAALLRSWRTAPRELPPARRE
ncbi:unnamed protein product, partial [Prorocentrum cordatum]